MKRTLLFVLALAVIPVGVDAQAPDLEETRARAEQGNVVAQYNLGVMYRDGDGVPEDDAEAVRWFRLAAEQELLEAQYNLGVMYRDGDGVPADYVEAVRWFRLTAEQGYASAQNNLGVAYQAGRGVPEDYVLAYMWWNLAAAQGDEAAQGNKDGLEQRMTREQIAEAQRLSREWLEAHSPGGN
jgi:TPR repeat protein